LAYTLRCPTVYIDNPESSNLAMELQKLGGARVILAPAHGKWSRTAVNGLGFEGELIVVAYPSEPIQAFAWQLLANGRSIKG